MVETGTGGTGTRRRRNRLESNRTVGFLRFPPGQPLACLLKGEAMVLKRPRVRSRTEQPRASFIRTVVHTHRRSTLFARYQTRHVGGLGLPSRGLIPAASATAQPPNPSKLKKHPSPLIWDGFCEFVNEFTEKSRRSSKDKSF